MACECVTTNVNVCCVCLLSVHISHNRSARARCRTEITLLLFLIDHTQTHKRRCVFASRTCVDLVQTDASSEGGLTHSHTTALASSTQPRARARARSVQRCVSHPRIFVPVPERARAMKHVHSWCVINILSHRARDDGR